MYIKPPYGQTLRVSDRARRAAEAMTGHSLTVKATNVEQNEDARLRESGSKVVYLSRVRRGESRANWYTVEEAPVVVPQGVALRTYREKPSHAVAFRWIGENVHVPDVMFVPCDRTPFKRGPQLAVLREDGPQYADIGDYVVLLEGETEWMVIRSDIFEAVYEAV